MRVSWCRSSPRAKTYTSRCGAVARHAGSEKRPSASVPHRPQRPPVGVPELDHAVGDRRRLRRRAAARSAARRRSSGHELVLGTAAEADRVVRPDGLRRRARQRHGSSSGVVRGRRGRGRCPSGSRAPTRARVVSRSNRATSSARAVGSRTELKIGSYANSGSPGKYICVTSRCVNARPKSEKWMCAGRQAFS